IGLCTSECGRVLELRNPPRLVIDVPTTAGPSPTAAPTPLPTEPAATDLGAFSCLDHSGGADSGSAMQLTHVRVAHQSAGYDRIVFEFEQQAGADPTPPVFNVYSLGYAKSRKTTNRQMPYHLSVRRTGHRCS